MAVVLDPPLRDPLPRLPLVEVERHPAVEEIEHPPLFIAHVGVDLDVQLLARHPGEQARTAGLDDDRHVGLARRGAERRRQDVEGEVPLRRGAGDVVGGEEVLLQRIEILERPRREVALAMGQPSSRRQLRLDLQTVVGAVGLEVRTLEGEQVGDAGLLEHLVEGIAQIVGVLEQVPPGLVGDVEEARLAVRAGLLVGAGPQPADVDRVDHAVGAAEHLQHPAEVVLHGGVAVALVVVHVIGLPEDHPVVVHQRVRVGGVAADEQPAVEPLGEEDDLLAPFHRAERPRDLGRATARTRRSAPSGSRAPASRRRGRSTAGNRTAPDPAGPQRRIRRRRPRPARAGRCRAARPGSAAARSASGRRRPGGSRACRRPAPVARGRG